MSLVVENVSQFFEAVVYYFVCSWIMGEFIRPELDGLNWSIQRCL